MNQQLMICLECQCRYHIYEPLEDYRHRCPYILIVSKGPHTHPVPLPTKTPVSVRNQLFNLLESLAEDLPNITPRRFIRHPTVKNFLSSKFPNLSCPTLSDWHVSLANKGHLKAYILQAKETHFPLGTGWAGKGSSLVVYRVSITILQEFYT